MSQLRNLPLRAVLFGKFQLLAPDGTEIAISGKRTQALLAMLCLNPGVAIDRDRLSEILWPGKFRAHARASLRQIVLGLKKLLAPIHPGFLEITRDHVIVSAAAVRSDLDELERALRNEPGAGASGLLLAIGGKRLLDQLDLGEPLIQWLTGRRAQTEQRLENAIENALAACQRRGDQLEEGRLRDAWRLRDSTIALSGSDRRVRIAVLPFHSQDNGDVLGHIAQGLFDELVTTLSLLSARSGR